MPELETPLAPSEAWLDFANTDYTPLGFEAAPPIEIRLSLQIPWPSEDESVEEFAMNLETNGLLPAPDYDTLRWQEGSLKQHLRPQNGGQLRYRLDPSVGFENGDIKLKGFTIRLWINF